MQIISFDEMLKNAPLDVAERIARDKKLYGMTEFTRRLPTFRTKKQEQRDARIVGQLIKIWDEQHDCNGLIRYFMSHCAFLTNPIYWETLRTVWVAAGSTETAPLFRPLMQSKRKAQSWFMTVEDKTAFDKMPDMLQLYRAVDRRYMIDDKDVVVFNPGMKPLDKTVTEPDPGISWTLDKDWCMEYATVHDRIVKGRMIEKSKCFAYISRRKEEEIIIL